MFDHDGTARVATANRDVLTIEADDSARVAGDPGTLADLAVNHGGVAPLEMLRGCAGSTQRVRSIASKPHEMCPWSGAYPAFLVVQSAFDDGRANTKRLQRLAVAVCQLNDGEVRVDIFVVIVLGVRHHGEDLRTMLFMFVPFAGLEVRDVLPGSNSAMSCGQDASLPREEDTTTDKVRVGIVSAAEVNVEVPVIALLYSMPAKDGSDRAGDCGDNHGEDDGEDGECHFEEQGQRRRWNVSMWHIYHSYLHV